MSKLKKLFASLFGISASEYSGFLLLAITFTLCSLGLFLVDKFTQQPYSNYKEDAAMLDSLLVQMEGNTPAIVEKHSLKKKFLFDPNTVSDEQLMQLGFPSWLSQQLINYRNKGGRFNKSEDLLKLYNFPDSLYTQVASYVVIRNNGKRLMEKKVVSKQPNNVVKKEISEKPVAFNLNKADTAMLQTIKGIGSVLSKRIISYRDKLGGFWNQLQLYEVYHLDTVTIKGLLEVAYISNDFVTHKIPINKASEKQLASHPYVSWKQAKLIVAYRNQHGNFNNKESLLNVYLINEDWLKKIAPYLSF